MNKFKEKRKLQRLNVLKELCKYSRINNGIIAEDLAKIVGLTKRQTLGYLSGLKKSNLANYSGGFQNTHFYLAAEWYATPAGRYIINRTFGNYKKASK